jgi:hypothetical protein
MSRAVEHSVKAHRCVPIEKVHDFRQILRLFRFDEVMDVVAHNAQGVKSEIKLVYRPFDGIKKHLPTVSTTQLKLAIIAPRRDVVGVS